VEEKAGLGLQQLVLVIVEKKFKKPLTRFGVIRIFNESLGRKNLRIVSP
jgi:hypothetical protein